MVPIAFDAGSIESTLTLDRTPFNAGLQQARADAEKLTRRRFQVKLGLDATALDREWERFRRNHRGLDITLDLAFKAATGELSAWRAGQERMPVRVPVEVNTRAAVRGMEVFRTRQAARKLVLPLAVDTEHARRQVETFRRVTGGGLSLPIKPELEVGAGAWAPPRMRQMGETIAEQMSRGFQRSRRPESAAEQVAQRMNRRASALVGVAWFAGLPAAAAVAAAGAAAAVAVVPVAFTAIGAAAVASSAEVKDAYSDLWDEVKATTREAAAPIEDTLIGIAERVGDTYQGIAPQVADLFAASQAPVDEFTDGLLNLAITALPGMTQAAQDSMPIMQGWNRLLTQIGGGLGDLFALSASGGPAVIATMDTLGGIVRDLLGMLGQLFANLATNGGPALADFRGLLQQVYDILLELTGDGFGLLGSAVAGFTDVLSTALTLVRAFLEAVEGWGGPILYAVGALKALDMVSFGRLGGQFDMITGKVKSAEGWGGKIAAGLRGGLIGAAVTGGLMLVNELVGLFTRHQRLAEQGARQNRDAQERYNQALAKTAGLLTEVSRAEILNSDLGKRAAANIRELGYDYDTFVAAVTRGGAPVNDILATNEDHFRELIALTGMGLQPQFVESFRALADNGQGAASMLDQINTLTQRYGDQLRRMNVPQDVVEQRQAWFREELTRVLDLQSEFGSLANAADEYARSQAAASAEARAMTPAQIEAEVAARALSESMAVLADTTSSAEEKTSALITTLDVLSGRHPGYEEAMQGFNDLIRRTADSFSGGADKAKGWGDALLNADGTVNTLTENGSKLQDFLVDGAEGMAAVAQAMRDAGRPSDEINDKLATMRDRLAEQAEALFGISGERIPDLLDAYNAVPERIVATLVLQGDVESLDQIQSVQEGLAAIPEDTPFEVSALTDEAQLALLELGYEIVQLPDGTFRVFSNTEPGRRAARRFIRDYDGRAVRLTAEMATRNARNALDKFIRDNDGRRVIGISVGLKGTGNERIRIPGTNIIMNADGGIMRFAHGTEDHRAQIAPPGAWRVWAEEETGGEAYIPLAQSKRDRSTDILATVADMFGYTLLPAMERFADGGLSTPTATAGGRGGVFTEPGELGRFLITAVADGSGGESTLDALGELQHGFDTTGEHGATLEQRLTTSWQGITGETLGSVGQITAALRQTREQNTTVWDQITRTVRASTARQHTALSGLTGGMGRVRSAMTATADWARRQFGRLYDAAADPTRSVLTGPFNAGLIAAWNRLNTDFAFGKKIAPVAVPFAHGTEDHRAQIAPPGAWRVWAEPETGGEAYIPLAESKRDRSTSILATVAERFGYTLTPAIERFADGGVWLNDLFADATARMGRFRARWARNRMGVVDADTADRALRQVRDHAGDRLDDMMTTAAVGAGVQRWRGLVLRALSMMDQPLSLVDVVLRRMNQESGGNPRAINLWDINAARGTPSKGLMQVIDPTFAAHADPRAPRNVWNPLANLLASMRYALARYGSLPAAYNRPGGYDNGGKLMPGYTLAYNGTGRPENVRTAQAEDALLTELRAMRRELQALRGSGGNEFHIHGATRETAERIVDEAMFRLRHVGKRAHA